MISAPPACRVRVHLQQVLVQLDRPGAGNVEQILDPLSVVEGEVRELVRRRGIDPQAEHDRVRELVQAVVADYRDRSLTGGLPALADAPAAIREVVDSVAGFGPLQRYFDDPAVEEIWVNEPGRVFIARAGRSELTTTILASGAVEDLVERMLSTTGRRVDVSQPFVDASLPDGSRLHVTIPDVTRLALGRERAQVRCAGNQAGRAGGAGHADLAGG